MNSLLNKIIMLFALAGPLSLGLLSMNFFQDNLMKKTAIESGCAGFNQKTGVFEWYKAEDAGIDMSVLQPLAPLPMHKPKANGRKQ